MKKPGEEKKRVAMKKVTMKSVQKLMQKRLPKSEIAEIENQAMLEARALKSLQNDITNAMNNYMKEKKLVLMNLLNNWMLVLHISLKSKGALQI